MREFYLLLSRSPEYPSLVPDRKLDYKGIRVDEIAEYASGYRETRGALERILSGKLNSDGKYEYLSEYGSKIIISRDQYIDFKKKYEEIEKVMNDEKQKWVINNNQK